MESPTTDTPTDLRSSDIPASRPGIRFVLCVAAAALGVIGYLIFS